MNSFDDFDGLFIHELKSLYDAERNWGDFLPLLTHAIHHEELRDMLDTHHQNIRQHPGRIEEILTHLGDTPDGRVCRCMRSLIEELDQALAAPVSSAVHDGLLVLMVRKIQNHLLGAYGTARILARALAHDHAFEMLDASYKEIERLGIKLEAIVKKLCVASQPA